MLRAKILAWTRELRNQHTSSWRGPQASPPRTSSSSSINDEQRFTQPSPSTQEWEVWFARLRAQEQRPPANDYAPQSVLNERSRKIMKLAAMALFDDGSSPPSPEQLSWFIREFDDTLAASGGPSALILRLVPWILEISPWLTLSDLRLFTQLAHDQRLQCLQRLEDSPVAPLSLVFFLAKTLMCTIYFEHPDALVKTGFDGNAKFGPRLDRPLDKRIQHA